MNTDLMKSRLVNAVTMAEGKALSWWRCPLAWPRWWYVVLALACLVVGWSAAVSHYAPSKSTVVEQPAP